MTSRTTIDRFAQALKRDLLETGLFIVGVSMAVTVPTTRWGVVIVGVAIVMVYVSGVLSATRDHSRRKIKKGSD